MLKLELVWGEHSFPLGKVVIAMAGEHLAFIGINCGKRGIVKHFPKAALVENQKHTAAVAKALNAGWPDTLHPFPVPMQLGGTPFQQKVWRELLKIPCGKTVTYSDIAKRIGKPQAVRAVGTAVGKNPISILIPCHRVVNKQGGRINYGWGAPMKLELLKAEGAI